MIAVDTNIVVYAHRQDSPHHGAARRAVESLARRGRRWAIPWPAVHEFLAIVTHPRVYDPPSSMDAALEAVSDLLALPGCVPLGEFRGHLDLLGSMLLRGGVVGPKVHDARIAAICEAHGVEELWTADRDFSYFPGLVTRNPLVDAR